MTQGSESVTVILRAEGFEDLMKVVIPESDRVHAVDEVAAQGGRARTASARPGVKLSRPRSHGSAHEDGSGVADGWLGHGVGTGRPGPWRRVALGRTRARAGTETRARAGTETGGGAGTETRAQAPPGSTIPDLIDEDDVFGDPKAKDKKGPKSSP